MTTCFPPLGILLLLMLLLVQIFHPAFIVAASEPDVHEDLIGCEGHIIGEDGLIVTEAMYPTHSTGEEDGDQSPEMKMDLSVVKVSLYTEEGILKESQYCTPNGYYFLPIPDAPRSASHRRAYLIRIEGPAGWTFQPSEVRVESLSDCKKDINFVFAGFTLRGQVLAADDTGMKRGPPGVMVTLVRGRAGGTSEALLATTVTQEDGYYEFANVFPGWVTLRASHPHWRFSRDEMEVQVHWRHVNLTSAREGDQLMVAGFDVEGRVVTANDDEPVSGLAVLIRSSSSAVSPFYNCLPSATQPTEEVAEAIRDAFGMDASQENALEDIAKLEAGNACVTLSLGDGSFRFPQVPIGDYIVKVMGRPVDVLLGSNKGASLPRALEISPRDMPVRVEPKSNQLLDTFQVVGFSVEGRVVHALPSKGTEDSIGVEGVSIILDGQPAGVSRDDGYFTLPRVSPGSYTVEPIHEHLYFDPTQVRLSLHETELPWIPVSSYDLCGHVGIEQDPQTAPSGKGRGMVLRSRQDGGERRTTTKPDGGFCFEVPAGSYEVYPIISEEETKRGLVLTPKTRVVHVTTAPLLTVDFRQSKVAVQGTILPLGSAPSVELKLTHRADASVSTATATRDGMPKGSTALAFRFPDVLPGSYDLSVQEHNWCWAQDTYQLDVGEDDVTSPPFQQTGYLIYGTASHPFTFTLTSQEQSGNASAPLSLIDSQGLQTKPLSHSSLMVSFAGVPFRFCLPVIGKYVLEPTSDSLTGYQFTHAAYPLDTDKLGDPLILQVTHTKVWGSISITSDKSRGLPSEVQIAVEDDKGNVIDHIAARASRADDQPSTYSFEYLTPSLGDGIVSALLRPLAPSSFPSLLFYPSTVPLVQEGGAAAKGGLVIRAKPGKNIRGRIEPPVEGVRIEVRQVSDGSTKGDVTVYKTDSTGKYETGPVYDDSDADRKERGRVRYEIVPSLDGYFFEPLPNSPHDFKASRYSSIEVTVMHHYSEPPSSEPLPGVLVSLSSSTHPNFRAKKLTRPDGTLVFGQLIPGVYYLRPLLKEYEFDPPQVSLTLSQGEQQQLQLKATRVAYSCAGKLKTLAGSSEGLGALVVQAHSSGGQVEECEVSATGDYILRGLQPHNTYSLTVKSNRPSTEEGAAANVSSVRYERASPVRREVALERRDAHSIDFYIFPASTLIVVSGDVIDFVMTPSGHPSVPSQLSAKSKMPIRTGTSTLTEAEVILSRVDKGEEDTETVEELARRSMSALGYFEFPGVEPGVYNVTLLTQTNNKAQVVFQKRLNLTSAQTAQITNLSPSAMDVNQSAPLVLPGLLISSGSTARENAASMSAIASAEEAIAVASDSECLLRVTRDSRYHLHIFSSSLPAFPPASHKGATSPLMVIVVVVALVVGLIRQSGVTLQHPSIKRLQEGISTRFPATWLRIKSIVESGTLVMSRSREHC